MPHRLLCVDTATPTACVGLAVDGQVVAEELLTQKGTHAEQLVALIDRALASAALRLADLDAIAVGVGPGSFIGVRIGVATVKGLAMASGTPLIAIATPAVLALAAGVSGRVAVAIDAKKGEVYGALYEVLGGELVATRIAPGPRGPEVWADLLVAEQPISALVGDGALRFAAVFQARLAVPPRDAHVTTAAITTLAMPRLLQRDFDALELLAPHYTRRSEAEEKRK